MRQHQTFYQGNCLHTTSTFPGEMEAVDLPRSRYLQVSNEAPAVKGGTATERSEAPLTGGGSAVARLPSGSGLAPLLSCSVCWSQHRHSNPIEGVLMEPPLLVYLLYVST